MIYLYNTYNYYAKRDKQTVFYFIVFAFIDKRKSNSHSILEGPKIMSHLFHIPLAPSL